MRSLVWISSLLLFVVSISGQDSQVVTLTDANFDQLTSQGKWLVDFYAPWCGHCKKLAPIYDETSLRLKEADIPLNLGKVDCTVETEVAKRFGIRGYPTIKYIRGGLDSPYKEARSVDALLQFAQRVTRPSLRAISSFEQIDPSGNPSKVSFLLLGGTPETQALFSEVSEIFVGEDIDFGIAENSLDLPAKFPRKEGGIFRVSEGVEPLVFAESLDKETLLEWVNKNKYPLVIELNPNNFQPVGHLGKKLAVVIVDPSDPSTPQVLKEVRKVAGEFREHFTVGSLDGIAYNSFGPRYGVKTLPDYVVLDVPTEYLYEGSHGTFSESSFREFLRNVKSGKIEGVATAGVSGFLRDNYILILIVIGGVVLFAAVALFMYFKGPNPERKID